MKVYEVKRVNFYGGIDSEKVFSSKKKAINFILSKGECVALVERNSENNFNTKWYIKKEETKKNWNKLLTKIDFTFHIYKEDKYFIDVIEVE